MRVNLQENNDLSNSWLIIRNDGSQKRHNLSKVLKEWTVNQSFTSRKKYSLRTKMSGHFGSTYTKIGTIERRLAWPLSKDDTQICEAFHIFWKCKKKKKKNKDEIYIFKWNKTQRICHQQIFSKRKIKVSSSDREEMRAKENLEHPKWRKINRKSKYIVNTIYYFFYLLRFSFLVGESKNDNTV